MEQGSMSSSSNASAKEAERENQKQVQNNMQYFHFKLYSIVLILASYRDTTPLMKSCKFKLMSSLSIIFI